MQIHYSVICELPANHHSNTAEHILLQLLLILRTRNQEEIFRFADRWRYFSEPLPTIVENVENEEWLESRDINGEMHSIHGNTSRYPQKSQKKGKRAAHLEQLWRERAKEGDRYLRSLGNNEIRFDPDQEVDESDEEEESRSPSPVLAVPAESGFRVHVDSDKVSLDLCDVAIHIKDEPSPGVRDWLINKVELAKFRSDPKATPYDVLFRGIVRLPDQIPYKAAHFLAGFRVNYIYKENQGFLHRVLSVPAGMEPVAVGDTVSVIFMPHFRKVTVNESNFSFWVPHAPKRPDVWARPETVIPMTTRFGLKRRSWLDSRSTIPANTAIWRSLEHSCWSVMLKRVKDVEYIRGFRFNTSPHVWRCKESDNPPLMSGYQWSHVPRKDGALPPNFPKEVCIYYTYNNPTFYSDCGRTHFSRKSKLAAFTNVAGAPLAKDEVDKVAHLFNDIKEPQGELPSILNPRWVVQNAENITTAVAAQVNEVRDNFTPFGLIRLAHKNTNRAINAVTSVPTTIVRDTIDRATMGYLGPGIHVKSVNAVKGVISRWWHSADKPVDAVKISHDPVDREVIAHVPAAGDLRPAQYRNADPLFQGKVQGVELVSEVLVTQEQYYQELRREHGPIEAHARLARAPKARGLVVKRQSAVVPVEVAAYNEALSPRTIPPSVCVNPKEAFSRIERNVQSASHINSRHVDGADHGAILLASVAAVRLHNRIPMKPGFLFRAPVDNSG